MATSNVPDDVPLNVTAMRVYCFAASAQKPSKNVDTGGLVPGMAAIGASNPPRNGWNTARTLGLVVIARLSAASNVKMGYTVPDPTTNVLRYNMAPIQFAARALPPHVVNCCAVVVPV